MRLRCVKAFGPYSVGAEFEATGVYRDDLLTRGFARPCGAEVNTTVSAATETAVVKRGRGRPRKYPRPEA